MNPPKESMKSDLPRSCLHSQFTARVFVKIFKIPVTSCLNLQPSHLQWLLCNWMESISSLLGCDKTAHDFWGSSFQVMCWPHRKGCTMRHVPWWFVYLGALLSLQCTGLDSREQRHQGNSILLQNFAPTVRIHAARLSTNQSYLFIQQQYRNCTHAKMDSQN